MCKTSLERMFIMKKIIVALVICSLLLTWVTGCAPQTVDTMSDSATNTISLEQNSSVDDESSLQSSNVQVDNSPNDTLSQDQNSPNNEDVNTNTSKPQSTPDKPESDFDLAKQPVVVEESLKFSSSGITLSFDVPNDGLFKLSAFDNTEYDEWPDNEPILYAKLINDNGETLHKKINISNPKLDAYAVKKGILQVVISAEKATKGIKNIALSWAFAPQDTNIVPLSTNSIAVAEVNNKGNAKFALTVDKTAMMSFAIAEACALESDCSFTITDKDGNIVVKTLLVHSSEWTSRLALLPIGEYIITVTGGNSLVTCKVSTYEEYDEDQLTTEENAALPAVFAFTAQTSKTRTITFTPTKKDKQLVISAIGSGCYYDSEQTVDVIITDKNGNKVYKTFIQGKAYVDISKFSGSYTITVKSNDSSVVELSLTASELQVGNFSYEQNSADCKDEPGRKTSGFHNTKKTKISLPEDVVNLAKNESKQEYDSASIAYDKTTDMWYVSLWNTDWCGGCIDVYIDKDGITKMTVAYE